MKTNLAARVLSLGILFLAAAFFAGCKTTQVDWNSRVGSYTHAQAVAELGSPDKQATLNDGKTVDQWITLHGSSGYSGGGSFGLGAGQPIVQTYKDHVLELTFGADGKLLSVAKNY